MAEIRLLHIINFRSIKELTWHPKPGLNCLIGPGDSGKSTVLTAIDLALGARRSYPFTDADFHQLNTNNPIEISVTLGALDDQLKSIDTYGFFLRSFDPTTNSILDEPQHGKEVVLTIKLIVGEDLDPDWQLYSERAESQGIERRLPWKHRELVTPAKLGATAHHHFAWGCRSVLNKLSEDSLDVSATLASIGRRTRQAFAEQQLEDVNDVLLQVKQIANGLGVPLGDLQALLDVNGVSLSNGAISLHNNDNTPLRQLGTGSSRLLISGLQKAASTSKILIVDEAEYGLEPFRITRLLNELGSKDTQPSKQVFISTHSPYVLRELQARQLHVLRKSTAVPFPPPFYEHSHKIYELEGGDEQQATLRACAEAFFSRVVIVGEGSTEVGLVRGIDLYCQDMGREGFQAKGAFCTDGSGGDKYFKRAEIFAQLGYPTALLKDSDLTDSAHQIKIQNCISKGVKVFEWGNGYSTEGALFSWCPLCCIPTIVCLAAQLNGEQEVNQHIQNVSDQCFNIVSCQTQTNEDMRLPLGKAANRYKWFKNIAKAEVLARSIIGPHYNNFTGNLRETINNLLAWVEANRESR